MFELYFYLGLGIAFGIIGFVRGFSVRNRKNLIENVPRSKIRSIAMGLVEVEGSAQPHQKLLKTPFSESEAVYYRFKIEEYRSSGKSGHWVSICEKESPGWFYVQDETGKVLVDPRNADLKLIVDTNYAMRLFNSAGEDEFKRGLEQLGINWKDFFGFEKRLRCAEWFIQPDDEIYVMGTAMENPAVETSEKGVENIIISKGPGQYFCISDHSEKELLSSLRLQVWLFLYGGPVLTILCLFLLVKTYFPFNF